MQRTLDHHQKKCRNRTDKRSKHRNDIRHTNDNRNQYRIWDMQNQTSKITDHTDDGRIYNLSNDETTKYFICLVENFDNNVSMFRFKDRIHNLFALSHQAFFNG